MVTRCLVTETSVQRSPFKANLRRENKQNLSAPNLVNKEYVEELWSASSEKVGLVNWIGRTSVLEENIPVLAETPECVSKLTSTIFSYGKNP